jgi:hypothetical protein
MNAVTETKNLLSCFEPDIPHERIIDANTDNTLIDDVSA